MKIGILQCDSVLEALQPEFGDYPEMFADRLIAVAAEWQFMNYAVHLSEFPQSLDECDGYITTGSRHSVYDDIPWIERLEEFVRDLNGAQKKLVGICFGHQLIARALGGTIQKSDKSWAVGVSFNQIDRRKPWMEPFQPELDLVVSHQDQVSHLPEGIEVLASSQFCPYYMLQQGNHFMSVQGHPEFSKNYSYALMDGRRKRIPANRIREGMTSLSADVDDRLMFQWIINFFASG